MNGWFKVERESNNDHFSINLLWSIVICNPFCCHTPSKYTVAYNLCNLISGVCMCVSYLQFKTSSVHDKTHNVSLISAALHYSRTFSFHNISAITWWLKVTVALQHQLCLSLTHTEENPSLPPTDEHRHTGIQRSQFQLLTYSPNAHTHHSDADPSLVVLNKTAQRWFCCSQDEIKALAQGWNTLLCVTNRGVHVCVCVAATILKSLTMYWVNTGIFFIHTYNSQLMHWNWCSLKLFPYFHPQLNRAVNRHSKSENYWENSVDLTVGKKAARLWLSASRVLSKQSKNPHLELLWILDGRWQNCETSR